MTKSQTKDMLWHSGKALLCALQFWILARAVKSAFAPSLQTFEGETSSLSTVIHLLYPVVTAILFFVLWHYYDDIDDRSFNRVCQASETPRFLRDPAYLLGIALTALTVTPILTGSFRPLFQYLGLGAGATAVSLFTALVVAAGGSVLRASRLNSLWAVQKDLPRSKKPPTVPRRIFYALVFFGALLLLTQAVGVGSFILGAVLLSISVPALVIAGLLFLWFGVILSVRNILTRRKFMLRLQKLRERGEMSVEIHGHPYLSILSERIPFGLTITDVPHPDAKVQKETVYRVAFANCKRRRGMVILCDRNIYQFVYALQFHQLTRFSRMGAAKAGVRTVSIPGTAWFVSHSFDFPDGEGERILLIDPTPNVLAIRNESNQNLIELDNASKVFGYTVYGKNSFVNMLERT